MVVGVGLWFEIGSLFGMGSVRLEGLLSGIESGKSGGGELESLVGPRSQFG